MTSYSDKMKPITFSVQLRYYSIVINSNNETHESLEFMIYRTGLRFRGFREFFPIIGRELYDKVNRRKLLLSCYLKRQNIRELTFYVDGIIVFNQKLL